MGTLSAWWQRLTGAGRASPQATVRPARPAHRSGPVVRSTGTDDADGLTLADEAPRRKRPRTGAAGFDPYSSDAGYSKPHSWERVDHD